ncbi:MAG TPA: universal stress protein [Candidatus Eisenbacteria bacterium]|nr:universal stress protein [Candidatus Eisenbacteria bacterium]
MSIQFTRILVPTDFSEHSELALETAMELAPAGGTVVLCHIVDDAPLTYGYIGVAVPTQDMLARLAQEAEKDLRAFKPQTSKPDVLLERRVVHGNPYLEIVRLAEEESVDLIVLGTHGRSGLKHFLIGSVAEKVLRKAPCPVLVVREKGAPVS